MANAPSPADALLERLESVAVARLTTAGAVAAANEAFLRLLGPPANPADLFEQPDFAVLLDLRAKSEKPLLYDGPLRVRPAGGEAVTLRGQVYRTDDGVTVVAERDAAEWDRLRAAAADLAESQQRRLQEIRDRDATIDRLRDEVAALERLAGPLRTQVTADTYGLTTLRESAPTVFDQLVAEFGRLLSRMMDRRGFRVDLPVSDGVRDLGEQVGRLGGGPRDVIDVYRAALEVARHGVAPAKARVYIEEGRLLVLELMGQLVSFYRCRAHPPGRACDPLPGCPDGPPRD